MKRQSDHQMSILTILGTSRRRRVGKGVPPTPVDLTKTKVAKSHFFYTLSAMTLRPR